jgi:molybdenum cofactor biosynthesis protein B
VTTGGIPAAHRSGGRRARVAVLTASDTRTLESDESGQLLERALAADGHAVVARRVVTDDAAALEAALLDLLALEVDAVIVTGGTGVTPRDQVPDVVARLCERSLPGFGELFRALSFAEIGSAALASRACAGQRGTQLVFALPGSPAACRLALTRLLLPELPHLVSLARGPRP